MWKKHKKENWLSDARLRCRRGRRRGRRKSLFVSIKFQMHFLNNCISNKKFKQKVETNFMSAEERGKMRHKFFITGKVITGKVTLLERWKMRHKFKKNYICEFVKKRYCWMASFFILFSLLTNNGWCNYFAVVSISGQSRKKFLNERDLNCRAKGKCVFPYFFCKKLVWNGEINAKRREKKRLAMT